MPSSLAAVPVDRRKRLIPAFGLFAALLIAIGVVSVSGRGVALLVIGVIAIVAGVFVALVTLGLLRSVQLDLAEARLDAVIEQALGEQGGAACGCGHDHDPDELHVTDAPADCNHDGAGAECTHTCPTCVLATLRSDAAPSAGESPPR